MGKTVCAVVVTYNRKNLLQECVQALRGQSHPLDKIIVVNNDSTDGTTEWLNTQTDLLVIHQENVGGAGGFYTGIKTVFESNYDYVWLMDDDGLADVNALEKLLECITSDNIAIANSLVLAKEDPQKIAFAYVRLNPDLYPPVLWWMSKNIIRTKVELLTYFNEEKCIPGAYPFNGTLIPVEKLRKVGNLNLAFFIRGEEIDVMYRLKKEGRVFIVTDALHFHPSENISFRKSEAWKLYYVLRNWIHNINQHYDRPLLRNLVNIIVFFPLFFFKKRGIKLYFMAVWHGLTGQLGKY